MASKLLDKILEKFGEHRLETISRAWCIVDKWERKHRLRTVVALSVELEKVRSVDRFSSVLGESAIEAVIQGDWRGVDQVVEFLTFESEGEKTAQKYGPLWEDFRIIAQAASAEARKRQPGEEPRPN
jgi:ASC-1-like (ASCH) protein